MGGIYTILKDGKICEATIRKTAKKVRIVVGDKVQLEKNEYDDGKYIITSLMERKNIIPRPYIANIDKLLIVIAPSPKPDLLLLDKLIIYCNINNIEPVIVINKSDLDKDGYINSIVKQYYFIKSFVVSALNGNNIDTFKNYISNSFCALCGQSAVGKSSIINSLIPNIDLQTQGLSSKIERGKHTTRANEIYIYEDIMISDTPGFSSLELDIVYDELAGFYPEFINYIGNCKYLDCSHIKEGKDCAIIKKVEDGTVSKDRYLRYVDLYEKLKKNWDEKYD